MTCDLGVLGSRAVCKRALCFCDFKARRRLSRPFNLLPSARQDGRAKVTCSRFILSSGGMLHTLGPNWTDSMNAMPREEVEGGEARLILQNTPNTPEPARGRRDRPPTLLQLDRDTFSLTLRFQEHQRE